MDPDAEARWLLTELWDDCESQGKLTCQACLRSKANPSPAVSKLIQNHNARITPQTLQQTNEILLKEYFSMEVSNTLEYISRLTTVIRFIQLLFTFKQHNLPLDEVNKMSARLIQMLSQTTTDEVCKADGQDKESEEELDLLNSNASKTFNIQQVVCFSFVSLLRLNHYAKTNIGLIAPLWKSICDLQRISKAFLPSEILDDAIQTLLGILDEGFPFLVANVASMGAPSQNHTNFVMQGKLISFLAVRLARLMKPSHKYNIPLLLPKAYKCLLSLLGMPLVACWEGIQLSSSIPSFVTKTCHDIYGKVEVGLLGVILDEQKSAIDGTALDYLLKLKVSPPRIKQQASQNDSRVTLLSHMAFVLGRVAFLKSILNQLKDNDIQIINKNAESLLAICESLHSVALPKCYVPLTLTSRVEGNQSEQRIMDEMIKDSLLIVSRTLKTIESSALLVSPSTFQIPQLQRLLIRWLGSSDSQTDQHPMTREIIISIIHLYALNGNVGSTNIKNSFLSLLVKILFEPRTAIGLRKNVSSSLLQLLSSSQSHIRDTLHALMIPELQILLKVDNASRRKKKRKRSDDDLVSPSIKQYSYHDLQVISRVLRVFRPTARPRDCDNMIPLIFRGILIDNSSSSKENKSFVSKKFLRRAENISLALAVLEGAIHKDEESSDTTKLVQRSFQQISNFDLRDFQKSLIGSLSAIPLPTEELSKALILKKRYSLLSCAILRFCTRVCNCVDDWDHASKLVPIEDVCTLLLNFTKAPFLPTHGDSAQNSSEDSDFGYNIVFDTICLLGSIGNALPPQYNGPALKTVKDTFTKLLSLNDWPIVSRAISALAKFGSRLHQSHQQILPGCLPRNQTDLFRKRLKSNQGMVSSEEFNPSDQSLSPLHLSTHLSTLLDEFCQNRGFGKSVFPSTATFEIAHGSYFIQMSTQEGRQALVVFPPGSQSLADIRLMKGLEPGDEIEDDVQTLKRTSLTSNGGCKCLLQAYK